MSHSHINRRALGLAVAGSSLLASKSLAEPSLDVEELVRAVATVMRDQYVDPEAGNRIAQHLEDRLATGEYATGSANELASRLTRDLRAQTNDQHLVVRYEPPARRADGVSLAEDDLEFPDIAYGIQTCARLSGNIGVIRTTHFPGGELDKFSARLGAAMTMLQDTRALIVDLTTHHGGGSDAQGYFMSYFLDGEVELRRLRSRNGEEEIISTSRDVIGPRYGHERPIIAAISHVTFSAGEGVALALKQLCNATLVGARTRGGGNAGNFVKLPSDFRMFVVMGQGTPTWEGTGVLPDVNVPENQAVERAYQIALQSLIERETDPARSEVLRNVATRKVENLSSFALPSPGRRCA